MTKRQEQVLTEFNPTVLSLKISDLAQEGWRVDPNRAMTQLGYMWECWMLRDATEDQITKDEAEAAKPSRAEILAKARAAKAEKARVVEPKADEVIEVVTKDAADE